MAEHRIRVSVAKIASSAVAEAVRRGEVATCSGRSEDLWRHVASKFGPQTGMAEIKLYEAPEGFRAVTLDDTFDHVVQSTDAIAWLAHRRPEGLAPDRKL